MIVDCAIYEDGRRRPERVAIEGALETAGRNGFVWLGLYEPTEDEFAAIRKEFNLHEVAAEDAVNARQRPKLEIYDDSIVTVLKTARYLDATEEIEFGEIIVIIGARFVVIVRHGQASGLTPVRRELERRPDLLALGPSAVLHAVMDHVVDDYLPVVKGLEDDIEEVEKEVFSSDWRNPAERIYFLKREVIEFRQAVASLVDPLQRLVRGMVPLIHEETHEYFRDVYDHVVRIASTADQYRDLLTSILEANLTQVNVRQNADMRRISAWVAIGVVPTLLAGIYGMNFDRMPALHAPWGFPVVVAIMGLIAVVLYRLFSRSGWL